LIIVVLGTLPASARAGSGQGLSAGALARGRAPRYRQERPRTRERPMRWIDKPIVAFDTETTGINPWLGDRMIEFGAVVFYLNEHGRIDESRVERHDFFVNPGIPIPPEVQKVTQITDEDIAGAPPFEEKADIIWGLLEDSLSVAHNYDFDQAVLASEFQRIGRFWPTPLAEIDTLDLSRRYFGGARGHRLGELAQRLDVRLVDAHRAAADAEACGRAFIAMTSRFEAPDQLDGLLQWADAIGRPPADGPLRVDEAGRVVFSGGPHRGEPAAMHPEHLAWMVVARARHGTEWQHRFPESSRSWIARFLRLRLAGRAVQGGRSFGPEDWAPESCAVPDPPLRG
jgi:DNA polymerase III epsilon subunit-like protein